MNSLLSKHRPKDGEGKQIAKEEWEKQWTNSHTLLQPLANVLKEMRDHPSSLRADDFDCPNHYAKLVAELVRKKVLEDILALLPDSVDK